MPSLRAGWQLDDLAHREVLLGTSWLSPWAMFAPLPGDPAALRTFVDSGIGPWWTAEDFRLAFLRVLTVATHRLDYALWPDSSGLMHAQSLLWFGLLVAAAAVLFRRVLGAGWVAGLAALAFAVDYTHAWPAAWIANRYAVLATFFGVLGILAYDHRRRDGWGAGAWLGPLALGLALVSGELAVATLGYLAAHALFLDPAPWRRRVAGLAPYGAVAAVWACVYRVLGFGVNGSGLYLDPGTDPARFATALVHRAPFSVLAEWTAMPADAGGLLAPLFPANMWIVALGLVLALALLLLPLLRRDAAARFFATGMLLSTVPISGTFPANRQLLFVSVGAAGLFAQLVAGAFAGAAWAPRSRVWRYVARAYTTLLLAGRLVGGPLAFPLQIATMDAIGAPIDAAIASLPADPALAGQDLIIVNAPDHVYFAGLVSSVHRLARAPVPRHVRALATGVSPMVVARRDAQSLAIRLDRGLFTGPLSRLYRDVEHPLPPGHTIALTGLTITIEETATDGSPTRILYRFDRALEDPTLRWVRWQEGVYVPFVPPAAGATVRLPPAIGPFERMGGWSDDTT